MGAFEATRLEGTQGVARPFWSPDSKSLAFFVGTTQLKKIAAVGGPPQLICETDFGSDGSWSSQGVILFDGRAIDPIRRVADSGGVPTVAVKPDAGLKEVGAAWPYFLPDGRHFLFMSTDTRAPLALKVGTLDDEKTTVLADTKSRVEFASGHLFYVTENTLMARPFDAATRAFAGDPFPVTDRMQVLGATGLVDFSTSMSGDLAYIGDGQVPLSQLVWLDRQGKETPAVAAPAAYRDMALSPDDSKLAVSISTRDLAQIWVVDLKRGTSSPLTFAGNRIYPLWSRDGQRILYHWDRAAGDHGVGQKLASGAGDEQMLRTDKVEMSPNDISPDDKTILVQSISADELKVVTLPADGTGPFADLLAAPKPIAVTRSRFSPDGKWIAYQSTESGRSEIFVQSYPPTGGKWQISTDGGNTPFWRGDGKEIFFAKTDDSIWSVPIRVSGPNVEPGVPVRLFQRRMVHGARERNVWVVSRDGQRFLLNVPPAETVQGSIQVVLNWAGGLARK
jgi:eukaryotic-like serine/threonine-protein kinase